MEHGAAAVYGLFEIPGMNRSFTFREEIRDMFVFWIDVCSVHCLLITSHFYKKVVLYYTVFWSAKNHD